jgi:HEAT repeat protein
MRLSAAGSLNLRIPPQRMRSTSKCASLFVLLVLTTNGAAHSNVRTQEQATNGGQRSPAPSGFYEQSWRMLESGSESENVRIRTDVIAALSSMEGDEKAIHLIENGLDDRHSQVRRLAASSLGTMHATEAIPHLRQAMNDRNAGVSFAAAEALWKMGDQDGAPIFYAVLLGDHQVEPGFITSHVNDAWSELHDPTALANIGIGEASGALLGPFSEGVTLARELAKDRGAQARALSATLLGEHPNPDSEKILQDMLDDKNLAVQVSVAKALGGFGDPALIERIAPLLTEKGLPLFKYADAVHFMAAAAIVRLQNHEKPDAPIVTAAALKTMTVVDPGSRVSSTK